MNRCRLSSLAAVSALFITFFFFAACSDEMDKTECSNRILFTPDVDNSWIALEPKGMNQAIPPSVSALQSGLSGPLYLHTLYTDSIRSRFAEDSDGSVSGTRATPVKPDNMYSTFGVSTYSYTGSWNDSQSPNYMYDVPVSNDGGSWMPSSNPYWPGSAYKIQFFAYAPKGNDAYRLSGRESSGAPSISCTVPDAVSDQHDLLVSSSGELPGNSNTMVNLTFRHALTAVKFVCGSDMKSGTIKSVTLKGVNSTGTYNFGTHAWSGIGTVKDFSQTLDKVSDGASGGAITTEAQTFMMIPQTLPENAKIEIVFDDGTGERTLTGNIAGSQWPIGKTVTYKISTSSINWEYVLTVTPPAGFNYTGGTNTYSVTSYKQNSKGEKVPVKWTAQFSTDDGATWSDTKPEWLTAFTASGAGGTTATSLNATVKAQTGTTNNPHTTALRARGEKGSSSTPYNLSNGTGGSRVENTANCYVIGAPGYYSFPLVYGNAIKGGATNSSSYSSTAASGSTILNPFINHAGAGITGPYLTDNGCVPAKAELVWQDAPSLVSEISYNTGANGGTISFKVDKSTIQQGNAVISIKDASDAVLWSWHLWVTDEDVNNAIEVTNYQNVKYRLMAVNLGWCDGESTTYAARSCKVRFTADERTSDIAVSQLKAEITSGGNCPYYQWGRKDPFRPSNGVSGNKIWYDKDGTASAASVKMESFPYGSETIKNYILKPDVMQGNSQYFGDNTYYNLWSANNNTSSSNDNPVVKTIYDPCPVGFKLPAPNAFTGFTTTGGYGNVSQVNGTWDSAWNGWNFYAQANKSGQQIFFPASGLRSYSGGSLISVGSNGYYWSAGPGVQNSGRDLFFYSSSVHPLYGLNRSYGFGVRPAQEPADGFSAAIEDWGEEEIEIDM